MEGRKRLIMIKTKKQEQEAQKDFSLIAKAQLGDYKAFQQLVERHYAQAFATAMKILKDKEDAYDAIQEAFLKVYLNLDSFNEKSHFFSWLYKIVTNCSIDIMRKPYRINSQCLPQLNQGPKSACHFTDSNSYNEKDIPCLSQIPDANPAEVISRQEMRARINTAVRSLSKVHKGVFIMQEIKGMSCKEMAAAIGVSKGTVMSRLFNARQSLQKSLSDCYVEQIGPIPQQSNRRGNRSKSSML